MVQPFDFIFALCCGIYFSILVSIGDSFSERIMNAWFRPGRKQIRNKYQYLLQARSTCESCHEPVKPRYLVPVFGYIFARGKCSQCGTAISKRFFYEDTLSFAYGFVLFLIHPYEVLFILFTAAFFIAGVIIARIDREFQLVPTEFILGILLLAMAEYFLQYHFLVNSAGATLALLVPILWWLGFHLIRILSKYQMGLADVRLVLGLGIACGYPGSVYFPTVAALVGILFYGLTALINRRQIDLKMRIPFAVYLVIAFLLMRLFKVFDVAVKKDFLRF